MTKTKEHEKTEPKKRGRKKDMGLLPRNEEILRLRIEERLTLDEIAKEIETRFKKGEYTKNPKKPLTGERIRNVLKDFVESGRISDEEYDVEEATRNYNKKEYFAELAKGIEYLDKNNCPILYANRNKVHNKAKAERKHLCLLAKKGRITKKEAEKLGRIIAFQKRSRLSLEELKEFTREYIETPISLEKLAIKYHLAEKEGLNPASYTKRYFDYIIGELKLITREQYQSKARENHRNHLKNFKAEKKEESKKLAEFAYEMKKQGTSYKDLAAFIDMTKDELYGRIYDHIKDRIHNKKKSK